MKKYLKGAAFGAATLLAATAASAENPDIGVIVPTLDAQFWNSYVEFIKKGATELGVDLVVLNADNKPDQMVKGLEDLVAQGVDGIIFTPYWATAVPGLTMARDAGIPVIMTDSYADFPPQDALFPNYLAFVGPSDRDAGRQMAEALFASLTPDAEGKKNIAVAGQSAGPGRLGRKWWHGHRRDCRNYQCRQGSRQGHCRGWHGPEPRERRCRRKGRPSV